ncbi:hypothetical protein FB472_1028 [Rhodoglobus vestalii]|uniref:Uncharacterized protein n=1 Tax=Rhodoglobus vestalii TaxID=193384 RepID=A0A8H2K6A5_9MICO|nr:hypothetical protein [Rhodoglobus vestalii]TQO19474.1 hypothetical protein FB472_1028 [Rhodoglobus vestalii]
MGFSLLGMLVSVAVLAPNLLLLRFPPRPSVPVVVLPRPLAWLERVSQVSCLVVPSIAVPGALIWEWGVIVAAGLVAYYALWARYLIHHRRGSALYAPFGWLPVPMAVFPFVISLGAGAWVSSPWTCVAAILLAAGHVPCAVIIARAIGVNGTVIERRCLSRLMTTSDLLHSAPHR